MSRDDASALAEVVSSMLQGPTPTAPFEVDPAAVTAYGEGVVERRSSRPPGPVSADERWGGGRVRVATERRFPPAA